jgi:thiamine-phosphate pyrophosphorylase
MTRQTFLGELPKFLEQIEKWVAAGVSMIQIREKALSTSQIFEAAKAAVDIAKSGGTAILINDRFDIAIAAGADGVHLTSASIPAVAVRRCVPVEFIIGVSTHSTDEAVAARMGGANFAVFGPVFVSPGKGEPTGAETYLEAAADLEPFPVVALGGIDRGNWRQLIDGGGAGIAGIRTFADANWLKDICDETRTKGLSDDSRA